MEIRYGNRAPSVDPDAYIAPTATLSGRVRVGPGSCVLHGAVLAADGGPAEIGANCVIMEHAVLRGTPRQPLKLGDHVLAGPHSYLTGCTIGDEVFIATGAMVFNGAQMGRASSVALGGAVHIGCVVLPGTRIPIGWVAVGDPARRYPPEDYCSPSTGERLLRAHDAELVSLRIGQDSPGFSARLPDVDPARPEGDEAVYLLIAVCSAGGQVKVNAVLDRLGVGAWHEADADGRVLIKPNNDLTLALGKNLPAQRLRPEPG